MVLTFYPQMKKVIEFYIESTPLYSGEEIVPWGEFQRSGPLKERAAVLGRQGNYHQFDFSHIRILREKGVLPRAEETTVVLFDWHEDFDNDIKGAPLTSSSWAYLGLEQKLYSNLYIVGTNPQGIEEMNPWKDGEDIQPPMGKMLRFMDRMYLYPAAPSFSYLKFFPEYEHFLANNKSVAEYFAVTKGGFAAVKFKGMNEVTYENRKASVVVSIDLDVLKRSNVKAICPQGVMETSYLIAHLGKVRESGPIDAILICGLIENEEQQDDLSLYNLSRILSETNTLLSR